VPIVAERWADAMETAMHTRRRGVEDVAALALADVTEPLGREGLSAFQFGCVVAMLAACWAYAPERDAEPVLLRAGIGGLRYRSWGVVVS